MCFGVCGPTVSQHLSGVQDLGALVWVCDVQLIQVGFLQSGKVFQALETMHGQDRTQFLKHRRVCQKHRRFSVFCWFPLQEHLCTWFFKCCYLPLLLNPYHKLWHFLKNVMNQTTACVQVTWSNYNSWGLRLKAKSISSPWGRWWPRPPPGFWACF